MPLDTLKALADPTRLQLLLLLGQAELTVQELTDILSMGQSRISRHLKILAEAGLVAVKRQGTWGYYRQSQDHPLFAQLWPPLLAELQRAAEQRELQRRLAVVLEGRRRRSADFFERHARQWDALSDRLLPLADYLPGLAAALPETAVLLEVGFGTGGLLPLLRRRSPRVIGVDQSPAMLQQAAQRLNELGLEGVELRLGEMTHLPLADGEAGGAVLNMVLHHAPQPAAVLRELARVVAPGGRILLADLQRHDQEWVREEIADQWLGFEETELKEWLQKSGLQLESYRPIAGKPGEAAVFLLVARVGG
jgi:DNA-binding transcriptional ArsR family regulator/precorrin-6B methylase 2